MKTKYYQKKIETARLDLQKEQFISKVILILKLIFFIAGATFVAVAIYEANPRIMHYVIAGVLFALYIILVKIDSAHYKKIKYYKALEKIFDNELLALKFDFSGFESGNEFINPLHEYSFDMDIFGEQSFFHRINRTITQEGKNKLADKLTNLPKDKTEIIKRQKAITELEENDVFRHSFQAIGMQINKELLFSIHYFNPSSVEGILVKKYVWILACVSILILVSTSCLAICSFLPAWIPFLFFIVQLVSPIILFKNANKYSAEIGRLHKNISEYASLIKYLKGIKFKSDLNQELQNRLFFPADSLAAFKRLGAILSQFDKRENAYALILLNGLFLNDLFSLIKYCNWKNEYLGKLEEWLDSLAEFEVLICFANANFNSTTYILPHVLTSGDVIIDTKELGHPFIESNKLVTNDFEIKKTSFSIITGANMAGKSTFLRSLGISYVMALNGMKVCAKQYTVQIVRLFSSMRNTDNLASGVSYFNAELIRIEQLINYVMDNGNTLIILDEILKGTNSKDKLDGSIMFLEKLQALPVSGVIATHDLALSELERTNSNVFLNYCFEISLQSSQMYTYKIQNGVCKNQNATYLLNNIFSKITKK